MLTPSLLMCVSMCIGADNGLMAPMIGLRSKKLTSLPVANSRMLLRMVSATLAFASSSGVMGTWRT